MRIVYRFYYVTVLIGLALHPSLDYLPERCQYVEIIYLVAFQILRFQFFDTLLYSRADG